jgi:imidazole glycerol-phosphate synthase subunit HisH
VSNIVMIDMDMGNLGSVQEAFQRAGVRVKITTQAQDVENAGAVIIPGVGAFGDGMESLSQNGLIDPILKHAQTGKPLIGICVGMQLLADAGEEHGLHKGLGLIQGSVRRLKPTDSKYRVPNMGWSDAIITHRGTLFANIPDHQAFYFAHSFYLDCDEASDVEARIEYGGQSIPVAVERGNVFGVQFHPEKSQDVGLDVLASYISYLKIKGVA